MKSSRVPLARAAAAGALLVGVLATGCAAEDGGGHEAHDPASSSPPSSTGTTATPGDPGQSSNGSGTSAPQPTPGADPDREPELAGQVTVTRGGGETQAWASVVTRRAALRGFTEELSPELADQVRSIVREHREPGRDLVAQVVAVGCDEPVSVTAQRSTEGWELVPRMPAKGVQCFAPMTTVAVFSVPAAG